MIYYFPPYFYVLVYGLLIAGAVGVVILIVLLVKHISKKIGQPYEVEASARIVAYLIDIYIVSIVYVIVQDLIAGYFPRYIYPIFFQAAYDARYLLLSPIYLISYFISMFRYYNPNYFSVVNIFYTFLPYIICFLYFFIFETALKGKTLGKMIFRVKSVSKKNRSLKFYELIINSLGKSFFCLFDLIIGLIMYGSIKKPEGAEIKPRQIRLMQRLAGIIVIRIPKPLPY